MERFYLEKMVEEINRAMASECERCFAQWLTYFWAMDRGVDVGDTQFKVLRFVIALDAACPAANLLGLRQTLDDLCKRFTGQGYRCSGHIGHDDWLAPLNDGYQFVLQLFLLENEKDHLANKLLVAKLLEDPETQETELPKWLQYQQDLEWQHVLDEVFTFCQFFVSSEFRHLSQVRYFEAAFWRVVNLACGYFRLETYEELVALMPARFQPALLTIPEEWQALREQEGAFRREDWQNCSRNSIRLGLHLCEMQPQGEG
ncbi:hypothetical protein [Acanthopleuribacter pedis]|uniref:Uncharacterized protein n=1 Tax=Acanthopleuribacter pedis TaxID=442870 RepID=A0A8J7QAI9_9BACT|nr:hypothetical protein [Acanthopleuribacter pedis]MBO1321856.1 hypothetical protein [Acanthopleuribacter pedis]